MRCNLSERDNVILILKKRQYMLVLSVFFCVQTLNFQVIVYMIAERKCLYAGITGLL